MSKGAAKTGAGPTVLMAIEQFFPKEQRILNDDFAYAMLSTGMKAFVSLMRFPNLLNWMVNGSEKDIPGVWGGMIMRKRYIDECLHASIGEIDAVVNLGAGFDTRSFRMPELRNFPIWEIDQLNNVKAKNRQLQKNFSNIPTKLHLVPMDFDKESISSVLVSNGYNQQMKTFFIWEGVTQYLTRAGIEATFDFLSNASAGSRLAFTYVLRDFIEGKKMYCWEKGYKKYVITDNVWIYGMNSEELPALLDKYGWKLIENKDAAQLAVSYIKPTGRTLLTTPIEQMAFAIKC